MSLARKTRKRPFWLTEEHWDELWRTVWSTEKFKEQCEQASSNRVEGNNGLRPSLNTAGSVSFVETKSREEKKIRKLLSDKDSFLRTHQHQQDTKTGKKASEWVDKKLAAIYEKNQKLEAEAKQNAITTGTPLLPGWEDDLWLQVVGPSKKGRIFGYGSMVSSGIGTDRMSNQSTTIAQDPVFIAKLKNDIRAEVAAEVKEDMNDLRSFMAKAVEEHNKEMNELRSSMAKAVEEHIKEMNELRSFMAKAAEEHSKEINKLRSSGLVVETLLGVPDGLGGGKGSDADKGI